MSVSPKAKLRAMEDDGEGLPVQTLVEAAPRLCQLFGPDEVCFMVAERDGAWSDNADGTLTRARVVPYITADAVMDRLDIVCPGRWHMGFREERGHLWCDLTIDGVMFSDVGEGRGKALVTDARKRAGRAAGIGRFLRAVPAIELTITDGHLHPCSAWQGEPARQVPWLALTREGEDYCRKILTRWMVRYGVKTFGPPLRPGNLTAPSEMTITGPPAPAPPAKPKRPGTTRAKPGPMPDPEPDYSGVTPDASPEEKLAVLLSLTSEESGGEAAQKLRAGCDDEMRKQKQDADVRLGAILIAENHREGRMVGLAELYDDLKLVAGVPDENGEPPVAPVDDGGTTT